MAPEHDGDSGPPPVTSTRIDALRTAVRRVASRARVGALLAAGTLVLAVAFWAAGVAFGAAADEYGFDPQADAARWRQLTPAYGEVARCGRCHEAQEARLASATHAGIGCESCHGALGKHALARAGTRETSLDVVPPDDRVCLACHERVTGRPASLRVISPQEHYVAACLACHDPHSGISQRPPIVEHTLIRLPACVTCHGPEGFKARSQRHPLVASSDAECLACHLEGRGPADDDGDATDDDGDAP